MPLIARLNDLVRVGSAWGGTSVWTSSRLARRCRRFERRRPPFCCSTHRGDSSTPASGSDVLRMKLGVEQIWVREAAEGRWFRALVREGAQAFISSVSSRVAGTVTYRLAPYRMDPVSVVGEDGLYVRAQNAHRARPIHPAEFS